MQINGHVYPEIEGHAVGQTYKNPRIVYRNMGNGHFTDVSAQMGPASLNIFPAAAPPSAIPITMAESMPSF